MISYITAINCRPLLHLLMLPLATVCLLSFTGQGVLANEKIGEHTMTDTVPAGEIKNINWNHVISLAPVNGLLVARMGKDDSLEIDREDYENYARTSMAVLPGNDIFTKVEIEPEYPGGTSGWLTFLQANMHYPKEAADDKIEGTVIVQFIVDREGNPGDVEAIGGIMKKGLAEEATRLVKLSGKWHPAIQNFRLVKAYKKQAVTFRLPENIEGMSKPAGSSNVLPTSPHDTGPQFPGGKQAWTLYLMKNLRYPVESQQKNIQGNITLKFNVDKKGRLRDIHAVTGPLELRKEAIRVVRESGKWMPARDGDHPVSSEAEQIIIFKLEGNQQTAVPEARQQADSVFRIVDIEASYPGGAEGWMRYLNKELRYPDEAIKNKVRGTVVVQFIVDKDGNVSDIKTISGPEAGGLRRETMRVIKRSGKWTPAKKDGVPVKSFKKQPLTFMLEG